MRKVLIATHGKLANGIRSALELFLGNQEELDTINAFTEGEEEDFTQSIDRFLAKVGEEDQALIFTDILGGSVNQKVVERAFEKSNVFIVTNINLPTIISLLVNEDKMTEEMIENVIAETKVSLLKKEKSSVSNDEEDFF